MNTMINFPKSIAFLLLVFVLSVPLSGQTAAKLEILFETPALNWDKAAAFVLEASDYEIPGMDYIPDDVAFQFVSEQKWLPKNIGPGDTARLNGIALLLMRSFDLKGGIFYSIAKSPHHAYRELVYKNVIRGNTDPDMLVSGPQLLLMVNRILSVTEEDKAVQQ